MENASKALIMAASIILGIMIISFFVFEFAIFKNDNEEGIEKIEEKEDAKFNAEFFKYYENGTDKIKLTPQDIISITNFVIENNLQYDLNEASSNSYYVTIDVYMKDKKIQNFEKCTKEEYVSFLKESDRKFKCVEIRVNSFSKRVEYVKYVEV